MAEQETQTFIYQFTPIRPELLTNADAWTEADIRISERHYEYLRQATADGIVLLAGRALDGHGPAIVIFDAPSAEAARQFMQRDPFVAEGLMRADLHPFRAALVRGGPV